MWERKMDQLPLVHTLTEDQTHNLGMCPDQESNQQHFALWTAPNQPSHSVGARGFFCNADVQDPRPHICIQLVWGEAKGIKI